MTRWQTWLLHGSNALVGATGLVYGFMRYFLTPADEFAVVNHPWQPHLQHLHVVFAPLLVFAVGAIWQRHALARAKLPGQRRRTSGLGLMAALFPMVFSGYFLQVAVDERWRSIWVGVHVATSLVWLVGYLGHQVLQWVTQRRGAAAADAA